jgi:1,4-alpha-glucan branching enzyme
MAKQGAFMFVLHSHLPYVRKKGRWPHGEEMLYEAMAETYVPLLNMLNDLVKEGYHPHLTLSLTPILLEQLHDKFIKAQFIKYLEERMRACKADRKLYKTDFVIKDEKDRKQHYFLADYYYNYYKKILSSFKTTYRKDLIKAFKKLQDKDVLDIITSSATHAYLPLFYDENSINEQLKVGVNTYKKYFGREPHGIWLPECGYRPLVKDEKGVKLFDGFENYLEDFNINYFFTDSHVLSPSMHTGKRQAPFFGPYTYGSFEYEEGEGYDENDSPTYQAYKVSKSKVNMLARDKYTALQVWSGEFGYPGDYQYREFHAKDSISGLQYCKITHHNGLDGKELYEPEIAQLRVQEHADHFTHLVEDRIRELHKQTDDYVCIVSSYDTELFGHWWFEGVDWLKEVLKKMEKSEVVDVMRAGVYLNQHPPHEKVSIPESSWGLGGKHYVWMNGETEWMWPIIHDFSAKMKKASKDFPKAKGMKKAMLNQALRELLLLHSSDWPFLISTYQAKDYATERFIEHKDRFAKLLDLAYTRKRLSKEEKVFVKKIMDTDNPFSDLDYTQFGNALHAK